MKIKVPKIVWALGDSEQSTASGVTILSRPIYYSAKGDPNSMIRVGSIDPDYAEPLMRQLLKAKS